MYLPQSNSSFDISPLSVSQLLSRNATSPADEVCNDINNCRTLYDIVWSCVATILTCTWVAIHPNIPPSEAGVLRKLGRRIVTTIYAIIAPELVVFWAAWQWFESKQIADKYKESHQWTRTHGFFAIMGGFTVYKGDNLVRVVDPYWDLDRIGTKVSDYSRKSHLHLQGRGTLKNDTQADLVQTAKESEELRTDHRSLPMSHSTEAVIDISALPFPNISEDEIWDRSKGDWISKGLTILQTSWFIAQCIARTAQKLPLAGLELTTCAFAALNLVIYSLWWNKPQSVNCPYVIGGHTSSTVPSISRSDTRGQRRAEGRNAFATYIRRILYRVWDDPGMNVWFNEDSGHGMLFLLMYFVLSPMAPLVEMAIPTEIRHDSTHVSPYYSGKWSNIRDGIKVTLLLVACSTIFGVIHCLGWSFEFLSHVDQNLWRICSLATVCLPVIDIVILTIQSVVNNRNSRKISVNLSEHDLLMIMLILILYVTARVILLVLVFRSLNSLPTGAYRTVSWIDFIPHI